MKTEKYSEINSNVNSVSHRKWQRLTLLAVLAYEAAGALSGGFLLAISPDGRLMDMNVGIMNGFFPDFFIPGCMLIGLGIMNSLAFIRVVLRRQNGWIFSGVSLCGLLIWFTVEIIVLGEFHWLHAMWGFPVILGVAMVIPLIPHRQKQGAEQTGADSQARIEMT